MVTSFAGDQQRPILYQVDRLRDGRSFSTRRVVAVQEGEAIFSMAASFQAEEAGLEHQDAMPPAPPPESLPSGAEVARRLADTLPADLRARVTTALPIEIRPVDFRNPFAPTVDPPRRQLWYRPFRVDEWLLCDTESPSAAGARGIARGRFFDRAGRLVASVVQEGLIRKRG